MGLLFESVFHDDFGTWPLGYIPYGGADFGEVAAVAKAVGNGDDGAFYDAFVAAADRMAAEAESTLAKGHASSARALYLRASAFYATAYHPIYGNRSTRGCWRRSRSRLRRSTTALPSVSIRLRRCASPSSAPRWTRT